MKTLYAACRLCPRACGVNRLAGEKGACGATARLELSRAALHLWEEPPLTGAKGSGTVFFTHCALGCVYCQNRAISVRQATGVPTDEVRLAQIFLELQAQGAQNVNLVTAGQYLPHVVLGIRRARADGLRIPVVYNCGGYESPDALRLLDGLVQIYLPDLKYYSSYYAGMYSNAPDYFEVADVAIEEMVRQAGPVAFDSQGNMLRGVIIRHLMLPGLLGDTKQVLRHIAAHWGDRVQVSLMRQYTPTGMEGYPELDRTVTQEEYDEAVQYFSDLGLCGYLQDAETASESFIPSFLGEGI